MMKMNHKVNKAIEGRVARKKREKGMRKLYKAIQMKEEDVL